MGAKDDGTWAGGAGYSRNISLFFGLLIMGVTLVPYIIILIAVWRAMKAHESIAQTLLRISLNYEKKTP